MATTISELQELMLTIGMDNNLVQSLDPATPLGQQGVDSLDCPAFAMAVEKRYGVKISDTDSLRLKTLNDFEKHINATA